jgi:mannose-6-phosphate isomerase-like protein (cupin superfamily)
MKATALAIIAVVLAIGLYQFRASNLATKRVRNAGIIIDRGFGIGTVQVSSRSNDTKGLSSAIIDKYDYDGPCSNNPKNPPKFERICTPPIHIHLQQDETFEVFEGQMGWYLDGKTGIAKKGETVFVPAGAKHTYWLEGEEDVSVLTTLYSNVSLPIGFADESFFEVCLLYFC